MLTAAFFYGVRSTTLVAHSLWLCGSAKRNRPQAVPAGDLISLKLPRGVRP
jgi:hypothetical protein